MVDALAGVPPGLRRRAQGAATWISNQRGRRFTVVHHIDADGLAAGAIALEALHRRGIDAVPLAVKSLDDVGVRRVLDSGPEALWFCDLGSAVHARFAGFERLVCDHHALARDGTEESFAHVNPLLDGEPGTSVSGAGCAFLVAASLDAANADLLPMALVGAAADLQDRGGGFHGANAALLRNGVAAGRLHVERDLAWFGTQTRPLAKLFAFGREPAVPTASGNRRAAEAFLERAGVAWIGKDGTEPTWAQLDDGTRRRLRSRLVETVLRVGLPPQHAHSLFRDVVTVVAEPPGPTRELQEFGTLLNGTGRYGRPEVGLAVARGDRGAAFDEAKDLLEGHRRHLVSALAAFDAAALEQGQRIQWAHLRDQVLDTVVGIVCGMALDGPGPRRDKVLVGLAFTPDGRTKASARAPHELKERVDLAAAMDAAATAVGGQGGGHAGAAGATIPQGQERAFLEALDQALERVVPMRHA